MNCVRHLLVGAFISGGSIGCCFPNKIIIRFSDDNGYQPMRLPMPLMTGVICSAALMCSPLLLLNYAFNGVYVDKWIDKHTIIIKRYHQYDGNDNKYAFPSSLHVTILNTTKG